MEGVSLVINDTEKVKGCCGENVGESSTCACGPGTVQDTNSDTGTAIKTTTGKLTYGNRFDHLLIRLGYKRNKHRVEPGLYALGTPTQDSPVFISANYTLSFDALRSSLPETDAYILVLDTKGINVWCAAGKGTFGTGELVHRIEATGLKNVVTHRILIVPQLGATGVSAHEVRKLSGFRVEYGPVRASDLPEYMETRKATPEMRRVRFTLRDRITLIPVELVFIPLPVLVAAVILSLIGGYMAAAATVTAILTGIILFPILLPWIPTTDFSTKGFIIGALSALPFALWTFETIQDASLWMRYGSALIYMLVMPPVTAFLALNFTGSTTFTSVTGVRKEIYAHVPTMARMLAAGIILMIVLAIIRYSGGM
ncbi:MAG: carbon monoxide dehydrogenase [Candidatus Methanoperedenaceae archaeon HGW-Methanoperedenaceae-1]|nr:MAG: carbon monoxide dehydrogenase [Candidatus Methanoperedenaceae archaeon HGW-Methanoperedenaceae-1]